MKHKTMQEIREDAKSQVAKKYHIGTTLVMGHREKYWNEAMDIAMTEFRPHPSQILDGLPKTDEDFKKLSQGYSLEVYANNHYENGIRLGMQIASDIITDKNKKIVELNRYLEEDNKELHDCKEQIREYQKEFEKNDKETYDLKAEIEELKKQVESLKGVTEICPSCQDDESKMPCQLCDNSGRYPIDSILSELSILRKENEQLKKKVEKPTKCDLCHHPASAHRYATTGELLGSYCKNHRPKD